MSRKVKLQLVIIRKFVELIIPFKKTIPFVAFIHVILTKLYYILIDLTVKKDLAGEIKLDAIVSSMTIHQLIRT